jgi:hypothetical protein
MYAKEEVLAALQKNAGKDSQLFGQGRAVLLSQQA